MSNKSIGFWKQLKKYPPGKRFVGIFRHRRQIQSGITRKLVFIVCGFALVTIGFIILPTPMPGIILLFFGASMLAQESLLVAKALDWTEIRIRQSVGTGSSYWYGTSIRFRIILTLVAMSLIGVVVFGTFTYLR